VAHLSSAWYPSGFDEALVVCLDGDGDGASGLIAHCKGGTHKILRYLKEEDSLGNFYANQLFFLGYERFDEYKAMGLAPYGDASVYAALFQRMYELLPDGRFRFSPQTEIINAFVEAGLMGDARRKGEGFLQRHRDYAAALQATLEKIALHIVKHFQHSTGCKRLCVSGGVAHNCTLNGLLLRSGLFEQMYVQPAAHDGGNALGAALALAHKSREPIQRDLQRHLYLGSDIGSRDDVERTLQEWSSFIEFERADDICLKGAQLIAAGSIIAWVQGRSEFGPRALGNRSILGDPRPAENKSIINALIKKREA
jgi:carbamoyltransferase